MYSKGPIPVFNTPTAPFTGPLSPDGRLMAMETIALPGTTFTIVQTQDTIAQVTFPQYPSRIPLYVDSRLLTNISQQTSSPLPSREAILSVLRGLVGTRYFWGGNWPEGIPEQRSLYPDSSLPQDDLLCKGVDCSGLLYFATNGHTPRNTSQLVSFGEPTNSLEPLDLIVWKGHVLIALSETEVIESRIGDGVFISPLAARLQEVEKHNPSFRRWSMMLSEHARA